MTQPLFPSFSVLEIDGLHVAYELVLANMTGGPVRIDALDVVDPDDGTVLRTWPERHGVDGFFCDVLRRRA